MLLVASLLYVSPASVVRVSAQSVGEPVDAAMARLDQLDDVLERVRSGLDRTRFDLAALGLAVAFDDADVLIAHLRSMIVFEPYAGVLRGAEGTLRSGAGNAHDQALLLATLLRDAGYDARIVLGRLSVADAERLVAGAFDEPSRVGLDETQAWLALEDMADLMSDAGAARAGPVAVGNGTSTAGSVPDQERVRAATEAIVALMGADRLGGAEVVAAIVEEARDYAWVEYLDGGAETWTAAHPAWREGEPPVEIAADEVLVDAVPERFQHRVRFQAFIERRIGDRLEEHPLMAPWERPVANAADRAFTFSVVPIRADDYLAALSDPLSVDPVVVDLAAALAASTFFVPLFDGVPAEGALAFDLDGNIAPLDVAADPAAGVFRNIANATARAATALGRIGSDAEDADDAALSLTAFGYDTTLIGPGGVEQTERRYVFDRVGIGNRTLEVTELGAGFEPHDVLTTITWSVHPGRVNEAWYLDLLVERLLAARPIVDQMLRSVIGDEPPSTGSIVQALSEVEAGDVPVARLEHLELARRFDQAPLTASDLVVFRPTPTVITVERSFASAEGVDGSVARLSTDIQANARRILRRNVEGSVEVDALEAVRIGVWETAMERAFAIDAASAGSMLAVESVFEAFDVVAGPAVLVEASADLDRFEGSVAASSLAAMRRDVDRGFALVVPDRLDAAVVGWWRIDPATGETLGMANDGRGQSMVEYLVTKGFSLVVAKSAAFIVYGTILYVQCVAIGGTIRAAAGMESPFPLRSCAVPLVGLGLALGGAATAAAAAPAAAAAAIGYTLVMYINIMLDVFGG